MARVRPDELGDGQRGVRRASDGLLTGPSVLAQVPAVNGDVTGPILGVDDEDAAGAKQHMVNIGQPAPGPSHVMNGSPIRRQRRQHICGSCFACRALFEELRTPL